MCVRRTSVPVVEILHEIDFCLEGVDLFFGTTRETNLLHGEQLPGTLVQSFKHLDFNESKCTNDTSDKLFRIRLCVE